MVEIERKFLVNSEDFKKVAYNKSRIQQGFLNTNPERTVRIRIKDEEAYITVKGKNNEAGLTRFEWEKQIDKNEAEELLKLCEPGMIDKTRFLVKSDAHTFEVDEFYGENEGLIVAEVELLSEKENFKKPDWLGDEVTGQAKYYNSQLIKNPYKNW
ncbi:CYTH domain-containing protein [Zunongwangia sp. HGR-M22]|uniref:CYTH domain-containing protein n=1 Tax=Zunongwangia sp. HGR-M22 TaxID=3015168 RepID=UPI0022DD9992|nr:CYTH domain-containing protein [Zunongwangia sp. HGR-M22]WBL25830.1 CYTH domain-containing protein [Zunongwangia sp. HGR-M22]